MSVRSPKSNPHIPFPTPPSSSSSPHQNCGLCNPSSDQMVWRPPGHPEPPFPRRRWPPRQPVSPSAVRTRLPPRLTPVSPPPVCDPVCLSAGPVAPCLCFLPPPPPPWRASRTAANPACPLPSAPAAQCCGDDQNPSCQPVRKERRQRAAGLAGTFCLGSEISMVPQSPAQASPTAPPPAPSSLSAPSGPQHPPARASFQMLRPLWHPQAPPAS